MTGTLIATAGPFTGVRAIQAAPYADWKTNLLFAYNWYFPNQENKASIVGRPGITLNNPSNPMGSGTQPTQGTYPHIDPATGTIYRFFAVHGVLYRSDAARAVFTDVTPVGITIDNGATTRVSFLSVGASLVVTDGVNRPWVASNFGATPITGAYIDIDGAGGAWSTWGKPTLYQDSVMWITATVPGGSAVQAGVGFVWSEPNQPAVGYTQTGYANFWNMIQTGSDRLTAILGTNNGLYIWRQNSITVATGTPSINFSSTATRDSSGDATGTVSPWAVAIFNDNIFFLDVRARPWMLKLGASAPQPIWKQMESLVEGYSIGLTPTVLAYTAVGAIAPELNHYIVLIDPVSTTNKFSAFDAQSGAYAGEWAINGSQASSAAYDVIDIQRDASGARVLCVCGGGPMSGTTSHGGYVYSLEAVQAGLFSDSSDNAGNRAYNYRLDTGPIGLTANLVVHPDTVEFLLRGPSFGLVPSNSGGTGVTVTPGNTTSNLFVSRAVAGLDGAARNGVAFVLTFQGTGNLGSAITVQRIELYGSTSLAGPEDL